MSFSTVDFARVAAFLGACTFSVRGMGVTGANPVDVPQRATIQFVDDF